MIYRHRYEDDMHRQVQMHTHTHTNPNPKPSTLNSKLSSFPPQSLSLVRLRGQDAEWV